MEETKTIGKGCDGADVLVEWMDAYDELPSKFIVLFTDNEFYSFHGDMDELKKFCIEKIESETCRTIRQIWVKY